MSEKEKSVQAQEVTKVKENEIVQSDYEGIQIEKVKKFIPKDELSDFNYKMLPLCLVELKARITEKRGVKSENFEFRVRPFEKYKAKPVMVGTHSVYELSNLIVFNDDSKRIKLTHSEYANILMKKGLSFDFKKGTYQHNILCRYRLITGIDADDDNRRHYRIQLFLTRKKVVVIFLSNEAMDTISEGIKLHHIAGPITFLEATSEELELNKTNAVSSTDDI